MIALLAACTSDPLVPDLYKGLRDSSCAVQITSIDQIPIIIANIIEILLSIIAALAVVFVIYAGIQYITSSGDPGKTASAKATLTNAAVGVILSSAAYLLVDYLSRQFS
jgi:hypothetical protein